MFSAVIARSVRHADEQFRLAFRHFLLVDTCKIAVMDPVVKVTSVTLNTTELTLELWVMRTCRKRHLLLA